MSDNVVPFEKPAPKEEPPYPTSELTPVNDVLEYAKKAGLVDVIVVGTEPSGEQYVAASYNDLEILMASLHAAVWKIVSSR